MGEKIEVKAEKKTERVLNGSQLRKKEINKRIAELRYQRKEVAKEIQELTAEWYSIRATEKIEDAQKLLSEVPSEDLVEVPV